MANSENQILNMLSPEIRTALDPHLKSRDLKFGEVLAETGRKLSHVYFPQSGLISLVVGLESGPMIETAMVGYDGVFGAGAVLDGKLALNKTIVQLAGRALVIETEKMKELAEAYAPLRETLTHHEQILFAQVQQSVACNAVHKVEERTCRWLLRMRDLAGDQLELTQEFLAQMMGVRRTSVTLVASTLQKAGLIKYRRGHVQLMDIPALEQGACECYKAVKDHYRQLLPPKHSASAFS
jgi:CRP-like cAMP-binding protein